MLKTNFINVDTVKFKTSLPDASTVVTYAKDSTPLSFFTDDVWDFRKYISSYTPSTIINFSAEIKLFKDHTHIFRKISNVIFKIGFSFRTA
jgi:hypothetical protein